MSKLRTNQIETLDGKGEGLISYPYEAGLVINNHTTIVRDNNIDYKLATSTLVPYTTTGAGLPEGGAFVTVGDATLRQDLVQPVATFNNVQNMKDAAGLDVGRKVRTLGYYEPGDGGGADYEVVAAGTGSNYGFLFEQLIGSGQEAKLLGGGIMEDKTSYIPSDYATLQEAIDDLSKLKPSYGATIDLMIEAGHQPESGVSVSNGDYGYFKISSENPEVVVGPGYTGRFVEVYNGSAPVLNCLIDANDLGGSGVWSMKAARATVNPGCGVKNVAGRAALYANDGGIISAGGSTFTGAASRGAWATRGGIISCAGADFSGARSDPDDYDEAVIYCSRTGLIDAAGITALNVTNRRIFGCKRGGFINGHGSNCSGSTLIAVEARRLGKILVNDSNFSDIEGAACDAYGPGAEIEANNITATELIPGSHNLFRASDGGSIRVSGSFDGWDNGIQSRNEGIVIARGITLTNCKNNGVFSDGGTANVVVGTITGSGNYDLAIANGGIIKAGGVTTTNGTGTPDINDTNINGFSTLFGRGYIVA